MKSLSVNKRHPVINLYIVTIFSTGQVVRTRLVGDRPCTSVCLPPFTGLPLTISVSVKIPIFIQPQMLRIQADFYVTACQIVCSVSLISGTAVDRITCYSSSAFRSFRSCSTSASWSIRYPYSFPSIVTLFPQMCERWGNIDRIIFVGKITDVGLNSIFI